MRHDFETWRSALSTSGVVVLHDINVGERGFGVWRLWEELRAAFPHFTFHHDHGLGVAGVGAEQAAALQALFALGGEDVALFRRRIAARGEAFQRQAENLVLRDELAAKDGHIAGLEGRLVALEAQHKQLAAKDAMVATLANLAAARAAVLSVRDGMIAGRDALAMQLARETQARLHAELAQSQHAQAAMARQVEAARAEAAAAVQRYVSSTSWRVTRPMRVAMRLLRERRLHPAPVVAVPPPTHAPAAPSVETDAAPVPSPKLALRAGLSARLEAFLSTSAVLVLPRAAVPEVSIVLVLHNQAELTFGCLGSIAETLGAGSPPVEVVILDNASTDRTGALLERVEGATVIRSEGNLHFLKGVNQAAKSVRGRVLLLNNDALLLPGAVASALRTLGSAEDIGAVGGRIIMPDGTLQEAGSILWRNGAATGYGRGQDPNAPDHMLQRDVDYCSGAFLMTPAAVWRALGGFDEAFAPAYYEETDYCVRLWKSGWRVVFDPDAAVIHYEFGSAGSSDTALALQRQNHAIFAAPHRTWLDNQFEMDPGNVIAARTAQSNRKRVLVIEDRVPKVELGTGYPRANRLLHELVAGGAEVALFPAHRHAESWVGVRRALDKRIEVLIGAEATEIPQYLEARRGHFDAVIVCRPPNMEAFEKAVGFRQDLIGLAKVVYDAEALFVTREIQARVARGDPPGNEERHLMVASEVALARRADVVMSVSEAERDTLEAYGARDVRILGHALDETPLASGFAARDRIVFLGAIQEEDAPNAVAVRWFAREILPLVRRELGQGLQLTVIGMNTAGSIAAMDD